MIAALSELQGLPVSTVEFLLGIPDSTRKSA